MDEERFDILTRQTAAATWRRRPLLFLGASALGLLGLGAGLDADARKKKKGKKKKKKKSGKCKASQKTCGRACCNASQSCIGESCLGACQFIEVVTETESRQLLVADCATTGTILVRDEFILDGNGNTIHMAGPVTGYQSVTAGNATVRAGVLVQNGAGSVKNLTIDQDALECDSGAHSAIVMAKGLGDIESVDIVVTRDNILCYRGIDAEVAVANHQVNVRGVTIAGGHTRAMAMSGPMPPDGNSRIAGEIRDCTIEDAGFGMLLDASRQQIKSNTVNANFGILVGTFPSDVTIDDNSVTGLIGATNARGILFNDDTEGTVSNTTVSGFTCGVTIFGDADVTFGAGNDFSSNSAETCTT